MTCKPTLVIRAAASRSAAIVQPPTQKNKCDPCVNKQSRIREKLMFAAIAPDSDLRKSCENVLTTWSTLKKVLQPGRRTPKKRLFQVPPSHAARVSSQAKMPAGAKQPTGTTAAEILRNLLPRWWSLQKLSKTHAKITEIGVTTTTGLFFSSVAHPPAWMAPRAAHRLLLSPPGCSPLNLPARRTRRAASTTSPS